MNLKAKWEQSQPLVSELLKLGWPSILAQIGQISVGLVDNMIIGQLGRTPLAAASFSNTIFNIVILFGMGFTFILTPKIGESIGKNSEKGVTSAFKNSLAANGILSTLLLLILAALYYLMPYMGQPDSIISYSQDYMSILILSLFPQMIFLTLKQLFEGTGDTKTGMKITLFGNMVNIAGDLVFVFGLLGAPELGLIGAGVGTLLARLVMAISAIYIFRNHRDYAKFASQFKLVKYNFNQIKSFFTNGIPLAFQMLMEAAAFSLSTIMMGWISEVGLAAHQIGVSLSTIGYMIYQGIGSATGILVSQNYGKRNIEEIKKITQVALAVVIAMSLLTTLFFTIGRFWLPYLFTQDEETFKVAQIFILWLASYQIFDAIEIVYAGALRGIQDFKIPVVLIFGTYFMISIPFSYLCAFSWGQNEAGIWMGFPLGLSVACILFWKRFQKKISILNTKIYR